MRNITALANSLMMIAVLGCSEAQTPSSTSEKSDGNTSLTKSQKVATVQHPQTARATNQSVAKVNDPSAIVKELTAKQQKSEAAAQELAQFQVENARLTWRDNSPDPTIEMDVKNGLSQEIAKVYFNAVVTRSGREMPLLEKSFSFASTVGLKAGDSAKWEITGSQTAGWELTPNDSNLQLTVTPTRIDGPNGETIVDGEFSAEDRDKLHAARKELEAK